MEKLIEFFSGLKMTIVAGVFLAISLFLMITKMPFFIDPAWVTIIICGSSLFYYALIRLWKKMITSALLISIAMVASIAIGEIFAAGEIAFIMALGGILEDKTIERAKKGINQLIKLAPVQGRVITDGKEKIIPADQIKEKDILRILPGEAIPVDGEILTGNTSIDQSVMTGESLPVDKTIGDNVFCGTINRFGSIDIKATKVGEDSSLQKLITMLKEAENNKAPTQRIVDKWAAWLVPIALLIAIIVYLITWDLTRGVTILVVFCPCALALATPTSIIAAIGQATKHGVIIKSGEALEHMGKVDIIAFDKTGTLTHGNLSVSDVISFNPDISDNDLLILAGSAEKHSEHPLGKAIVAHTKEKGLILEKIENFKMEPGKGISADLNGCFVQCGNSLWLKESGITFDEKMTESLEQLYRQGKAVILVSRLGKCEGLIALSDTLRIDAKNMMEELKRIDTSSVLLTGDTNGAADYFATQLGIDSVYAQLLPAQKVEKIKQLQSEGHNVCMIGDGVNDAPALKMANVGVAMGIMGSDISIEAADIALMSDDIAKIPYLKRLSKATVKMIKFNISLSMLINFTAIILSALALLNPVTGALVHNAGSVLVVLNAALLYDRKI